MSLPITVTYTFATATSSIPLSQLDSNFTTVVNAINGIGNGTNSLANVSITGGSIDNVAIGNVTTSTGKFTTVTATTGNITTINATTLNAATHRSDSSLTFQSNGTTTAMTISSTANVGIGSLTTSPPTLLSVGSANAVYYNQQAGTASPPVVAEIISGSIANPVTNNYPSVAITRREAITTDSQGGQNAALYVESQGNNTSNVGIIAMTTAITAYAKQNTGGSGDVVGVYGAAIQNGTTSPGSTTYTAFGSFFAAQAASASSSCFGTEYDINNSTGTNLSWATYTSTNQITCGIDNAASGPNLSTAGMILRNSSNKFDMGIAFKNNSTLSADVYSESSAVTTFYDKGSHTTGIDLTNATYSGNSIQTNGTISISNDVTTSSLIVGSFGHKIGRQSSTGSLLIGGGQANVTISSSNPMVVSNTSNSTSTSTGALIVSGGAGISGNVTVGGNVTTSLVIGGTANNSTLTLQSTSGAGTSDSIVLKTGSQSSRMSIDTNGNILINTTLTNLYAQSSGYGVCFRKNASLDVLSTSDNAVILNRTGTDGGIEEFRKNGTIVGSISVTSSATAYNTSSDYRLKENVHLMSNGLATVSALKPVRYDWIRDKSAGEGFIAHELAEVIPAAVTGEKDAVDNNGEPVHQGVDYSKIVVHLVAAIQELSAKNDALETRLAALEVK
jgi:hypothetical protein